MGSNVTKANLKNLVTDKPSPITLKLAEKMVQVEKKQNLAQAKGVPVFVNPIVMQDEMGDAKLDLKMMIGPDEV